MASLNVERAHERAIRSAMREVRRIWLETWRNGEPSPRSEMLRWRDRAWFKKVTARQNLRSGGTKKSYKETAHLRHAGSGVRHTHEDVFAAVLGDGWKRSCLDNEELWNRLEDFVIWQTCLRCQLPISPGVEMRAKKRMGNHQEPAEWLESIGVHKEAEGFGWYKAQEALGKNERGQDSDTEDMEEKQRAIEAIFEEGED